MLKKWADIIKSWFSYPKELKEMELRAKETNRIYQSALKKANVSPKPIMWEKDFKAEDVKKALDKQAPKPKGKTMPLKKSTSKKAFESNIKTEAKTKPVKQAVAIAYAVKREAAKKSTKKSK